MPTASRWSGPRDGGNPSRGHTPPVGRSTWSSRSMSRSTWHPAALMLACVAGATLVTAGAAQPKAPVRVPLQDLTAKKVGSLELRERGGGLEFRIRVTGLSAGGHGMHIHAIGVCSPPEFGSAGSHLNPFRRQ